VKLKTSRLKEPARRSDLSFLPPVGYPPDAPSDQADKNDEDAPENPPCGHDKANLV
jgi:hypothetical protein